MHVIQARNVAEALPLGVGFLLASGQQEESRAGKVLVAPTPVSTVYSRPWECVLFSALRDANPFFHLAEACWMLAGRRDTALLDRYVKDYGTRFAEPHTGWQWGAYGYRWRTHFDCPEGYDHEYDSSTDQCGFDQLRAVIDVLSKDPTSRQAVLSMWDPPADLARPGLRDRPCNTHAYFRLRTVEEPSISWIALDMTVCCRSNDIIWGAYGANAVHFAFLQVYLAGMLCVGLGTYTQVSNNYHMYLDNPVLRRAQHAADMTGGRLSDALRDQRYLTAGAVRGTPADLPNWVLSDQLQPLVTDPATFDTEVAQVLGDRDLPPNFYTNKFLGQTVYFALAAHRLYRDGDLGAALAVARGITAQDWRVACVEWLERRGKA